MARSYKEEKKELVTRRASSAPSFAKPPLAFLSPVILVTSGNKEAVVGGFMGIVIVSLWNCNDSTTHQLLKEKY